jgi:hypothetical protein
MEFNLMAKRQQKTNYHQQKKGKNKEKSVNKKIEIEVVSNDTTVKITETKKTFTDLVIYIVLGLVALTIIGTLCYFIYLYCNVIVVEQIKTHHINNALEYGYEYIQYMVYKPSMTIMFMTILTIIIGCSYIGLALMIIIDRQHPWEWLLLHLAILSSPFIITMLISYQNIDKFMAPHISSLYDLVNTDKTFKDTNIERKFKKAIEENDYVTLKTISNDLSSLAKVSPEQLAVVEEIVNVIPITEIKGSFNTFKNGFISYAEYNLFYANALTAFYNSSYRENPELSLLLKKMKITTYDYNQLKIDISKK